MKANTRLLRRLRISIERANYRGDDGLQWAEAVTYVGSLLELEDAGFITREHSEKARTSTRWYEGPVSEFGDALSLWPIDDGPYGGQYSLRCLIGVNEAWLSFDEPKHGFKGRAAKAVQETARFLKRLGREEQRA